MEATVQLQSSSTPVELDQRSWLERLRTIYELLLDSFAIEIDNRFGAICSEALLLLYQLHMQHRRRLWWSALQPNEMKRGRGESGGSVSVFGISVGIIKSRFAMSVLCG
jgi:hypothetical protein